MRILFISIFILSFSALFAGNYSIDKKHSTVGFEVSHMVISDVTGKFTDFNASLTFDADNLSDFSVEATIKMASVNTEDKDRDDHLRKPDFFDVAKHPEMTFKGTKIKKSDDGYIVSGTLTMRGVSKEVDLPFEVKGPIKDPWGNTRIGVEASTVINRKDFGINWSKTLDGGGLMVGNDVEIKINAEFTLNK
jgi:polyisoprenoid-binding protein YceI